MRSGPTIAISKCGFQPCTSPVDHTQKARSDLFCTLQSRGRVVYLFFVVVERSLCVTEHVIQASRHMPLMLDLKFLSVFRKFRFVRFQFGFDFVDHPLDVRELV